MDHFLSGTLWIWLCAIVFILLCVFIANESGTWATVVLIASIVGFYFFIDRTPMKDTIRFVLENPLTVILSFVGYVLIGLFWSFFKWYEFVKGSKQENKDQTELYRQRAPEISKHKDDVFRWIFFFPISMILQFFQLVFKDMFTMLYKRFEKTYQSITNSIYKTKE